MPLGEDLIERELEKGGGGSERFKRTFRLREPTSASHFNLILNVNVCKTPT
jgi:hypothetical protein